MTFILRHKIPILLFILSGFVIWPLLLPGFFKVQDYLHVIRIFEMRRCIEDLQIPCRWVADMGSGFGFPLFNYYGGFPYYFAAIASYFLGYIGAVKLIFFLPLVSGGIFMYFLVKEVWGKDAAVIAAVLYLFAPYRALDVYVRGSITEVFAMSIIPLVFYFFLRLIKFPGRNNFLAATFTMAIFLLNHNLMTMLFFPLLIAWIIYWLFIQRSSIDLRKTGITVMFSMALGFMLASFFILPAYFEQNLIQDQNLRESELIPNFRAHFVTINQLFSSRFWGYGVSTWGDNDGLSFQVGWPHWQLVFIAICLLLFQQFKNKSFGKNNLLYFIFFSAFIASLLMTHNKSAFLWELFGKLQFVQFPWRFLSVTIFSASFLGGAIVLFIKNKYRIYFIFIITILTVLLNYRYFKPVNFEYNLSDKDLLTGSTWEFYQQGSLTDYLPLHAQKPNKISSGMPVSEREAKISNFKKLSNQFSFQVEVKDRTLIDIPIFDFPNWQVFANGLTIGHTSKGEFGTIRIELDKGHYLVNGYFKNTRVRTAANALSVAAAGIVLLVLGSSRWFGWRWSWSRKIGWSGSDCRDSGRKRDRD